MHLTAVLKQPNSHAMYRCISPPLIEKASCSIKMVEVVFVRLTAPELHIRDLKIAPEMARRIAIRQPIMFGSSRTILQPIHRIIAVYILRMFGQELDRLRPQRRDRLRRIVQVDGEAIGLVVILHVGEHVVVDVAEEVNFGLDTPVVAGVRQCGVLVEEAGVPAAHLVIGDLITILDVVLGEKFRGFVEEVVVDPGGDFPVLFWNQFWKFVSRCWERRQGWDVDVP